MAWVGGRRANKGEFRALRVLLDELDGVGGGGGGRFVRLTA